jgi:hypothetical protein
MEYNHRYLSRLLQPRTERRPRVLWLAIPWLFVVPWTVHVAQVLWPSAPMHGFAKGTAAVFMFVDLFFLGVPGVLLTWGWLYLSWPEHPRVCCWVAAAGMLSVWVAPISVQGIMPMFIALAMIAAIVEQAVAGRRAAPG